MTDVTPKDAAALSELPQQAYDLLVDQLGSDVSIEDIWIEGRDEGNVCIVEVHSDPQRAAQVLSDLETTCERRGLAVRFIVREPRVTATTHAHLRHAIAGEVRTLCGPFHRESDRPSLLLVSTPKEPLVPDTGWDATFRTPWDEITLHSATLKRSASCTGLESSRVSVSHFRRQ